MTVFDSRQWTSVNIKKFDQFLVRCGENESNAIVLSRFHSGVRKDLRRELFAREVSTLEQV